MEDERNTSRGVTPSAQKKAFALQYALKSTDYWRKLHEAGIKPAIVITHEEMVELKNSDLFKFWTDYKTRSITIVGIHICEEED